ncbi:MAG: hypothetical protein R3F39_19590 [Myxococcota bacterium]
MDAVRTTGGASIEAKLDQLSAQVALLVRKQDAASEMWAEFSPIVREVMRVGADRLESLEQRGYFAFGRELVERGRPGGDSLFA